MNLTCSPFTLSLATLLLFAAPPVSGQAPIISKIDPPNWYASLPAPMLLVKGENLNHAAFALSDSTLHIDRVVPSENGHYAQLWLTASPQRPEAVTLSATTSSGRTESRYIFSPPRAASDGVAGVTSRDVLYLIMQDRFADGDLANDGPRAGDAATSLAAIAERAKPKGWHGGDLRGVEQHLDYIQQLGATAIWLTPVYGNDSPVAYHGYHSTDKYAVDPHFGTLADLKSLAQALHRRGMKLVLDTVPNHEGPFHPWVADEPSPTWFHGTADHHIDGATDFRALIDPHGTDRDRLPTLHGWFVDVPPLPDNNTEDPTVAIYQRQNAIWWIEETGADGLRIDTFPYVDRPFWNAFDGQLRALFPRITEVGEIADGDPAITSAFAGGVTRAGEDTRLYTPFDFPSMFAMRDALMKGTPLSKIAHILAQDSLYPHPERLVLPFDNHDQSRLIDSTSPEALRLAYAFVMTMRGTPQLYYGDEIAMHGGNDPDNRRDFPGGFPPAPGSQAHDAFTAKGRTPDEQATFDYAVSLGKIRAEHLALQCGAEQVLAADNDWLIYLRDAARAPHDPELPPSGVCPASNERVLIVLHRGSSATKAVDLTHTWASECRLGSPILSSSGASAAISNDQLTVSSPGIAALIAVCQSQP